jgi:tetratricopeptide (TPR) repeat protein
MRAQKQSLNGAGPLTHLELPRAPRSEAGAVKAWKQAVAIPTYEPGPPDRNPMFLEKRVYQGSSGRVYPLPFIDRIATGAKERLWEAVHLENEYLRLMILPEIGGRIHIGYDKRNGYDFFYRQNVIKPALVGLAGPWISGGVEFNWPQHHRPATFMPVEVEIEHCPDGSVFVWCGDHDPMLRMKGMHGVGLHPGKAYLEVRARLYNRTSQVQTFLWWANMAARVHEKYQSFFPGDVRFVADHAKRAVSSFPGSNGVYYGIDYAERARSGVAQEDEPRMFVPDGTYPANDLSWYANIPVPTSYMVTGTALDFFGGYDHAARAGVVHVATHQIAPGKKQWTWGNHEFGYAWDRSLTDADGPYVELMAGVYSDNQPDFSFLAPGETKSFSQHWYPIREIGPPQAANVDAALSMHLEGDAVSIGVCVTKTNPRARILLWSPTGLCAEWREDLSVNQPWHVTHPLPDPSCFEQLSLSVEMAGKVVIEYSPRKMVPAGVQEVATEPDAPEEIATNEELYLIGLHLDQYRHATRNPEIYWLEALRRDPGDSRVNNALGCWHLRRGELSSAEGYFRAAIARLTRLNPNPYDGEAYYNLGLGLRLQGRGQEAYSAFYKATWNAAWRGPAYHALAEFAASRSEWPAALDHVQRALVTDADNLNARNLKVMVLRKLGRSAEAEAFLKATRALDRLDTWSRYLEVGELPAGGQQILDLSLDLARSGFNMDALDVLCRADLTCKDGSAPVILYQKANLYAKLGDLGRSAETYRQAAQADPLYCFPSRLEEMLTLELAMSANPGDSRAPYLLGNMLYDRRRHEEAITQWEAAAKRDPEFPTNWRNLGIAYFNVRGDAGKALDAFDRAHSADPQDARILYERDQLWKRVGKSPEERLASLQSNADLVSLRHDLTVEMATLLNQTGEPESALELLTSRIFQPWEGGEGLVLAQFVRSNLLLGQRALADQDPSQARRFFETVLSPPENLGEAKHLLANWSDVFFWIGVSCAEEGRPEEATRAWQQATRQRGDFQEMSVRSVSDKTFWTGMAYTRLGQDRHARELFQKIYDYSLELEQQTPRIDYFATSLPAMLLFENDLGKQNQIEAKFLRAQALVGLEQEQEARALLSEVLRMDRNHPEAADLVEQLERGWLRKRSPHEGHGFSRAAQNLI